MVTVFSVLLEAVRTEHSVQVSMYSHLSLSPNQGTVPT